MSARGRKPVAPPPLPLYAFEEWFSHNWIPLTKIAMFLLGLAIGVNNFFIEPKPDPLSFGAMMGLFGLPFTFGRNGNGNEK